MRENEFKDWIRNESGLTPGNAGQWVSYGRRVERDIGDLDRWYRKYPNVSDARSAAVAKGAPNKECRVLEHYWKFCKKYPPGSGAATTAASPAGGRRSALDTRTQESSAGNRGNRNAGGANNNITSFWNPNGGFDKFVQNDDINWRIWENSPARQSGITPCPPNDVGAQQAMLESGDIGIIMAAPADQRAAKSCKDKCCCLPWVPDLVGKNWKEKDAILVFGSAYAGFIEEYSGGKGVPVLEYARAKGYWDFQKRLFLPQVVSPPNGAWGQPHQYYGKIAKLLMASKYNSVEKVVVSDLCRASFVKKGFKRNGDRKDKGGDGVVRKFPDIFSNYVSHNNDWTWKRIKESQARRIVALGSIAEHGLIRLFVEKLDNGSVSIQTHSGIYSINTGNIVASDTNDTNWVKEYAGSGNRLNANNGARQLTLQYWIDGFQKIRNISGELIHDEVCVKKSLADWWVIKGKVENVERTWHLLPVHHPRSTNGNRIKAASKIIRSM